VTCIPIARQRVSKHIPTTQAHATTGGHSLLGNEPVNSLDNRRRCFPRDPCQRVVRGHSQKKGWSRQYRTVVGRELGQVLQMAVEGG
jgi:hypothetical protein